MGWNLKQGDDFTKSGAVVDDFQNIGAAVHAICKCPNGRKYKVGGLGTEDDYNFDKSCIGGLVENPHEGAWKYRSVKCHNLGWPPANVAFNHGCNENNADSAKCRSYAQYLYYHDISFSVLYLSTENWRSFRYHHDELAKQVPGLCTFLMKLATEVSMKGRTPQKDMSNYLDRQW